MLVASHATKNDVILFTTLERIHARDFDILVKVLLKGTAKLHIIDDIRSLSFVRGYHTNLAWYDAGLEKLGHNLLDIGCFSSTSKHQPCHQEFSRWSVPIQERCST